MTTPWQHRLNDRPDWAKVVKAIAAWSDVQQQQLSDWVEQFHLNPNMALEAAILMEECRLQRKTIETLSTLDPDKGQASAVFMKALRTLRYPQLQALRDEIAQLKKQLRSPNAQIHYSDDLESDAFELRYRVRSMQDWDALATYMQTHRNEADALLQTIKTGHVDT